MPTQPDPASAADAADFVRLLGELRVWAGSPSLRTLRRLGGSIVSAAGDPIDALPESTTSYLLNGRGLPRLPRMEFVEAYVSACLRAAGRSGDPAAELEPWRTAWSRIALGTDAEPAETGPADAGPADAGSADAGPAAGRVAASGRRPWRIVGVAAAAAGLVCIGLVAGLLLAPDPAVPQPGGGSGALAGPAGSGGSPGGAAPRLEATILPAPPVLRRGAISMDDYQDADLDTGALVAQNAPGADLGPWGLGNHLNMRGSAMVMVLPPHEPGGFARCAIEPVARRVRTVDGLQGFAVGRKLCVITSDGHLAVLELDRTPSPADGRLVFHYTVWSGPAPTLVR